jgi:hypothetical protein
MKKNKNDQAWEALFDAENINLKIQRDGIAFIDANSMKRFREPRLMAKIDTIDLLPKVFKKHKVSILPIKNGEYILFRDPDNHSFITMPDEFDSLEIVYHEPSVDLSKFDSFENLDNLNESQALDSAVVASIIKDFTEEREIWMTIRGRQFTGDFNVFLPSIRRSQTVSHVQIEVDAGFESNNAIYLFEAKIGKRQNFNVRQLLYPYMEWNRKSSKKVVPIFFFFTNGLYYLFQFNLSDALGSTQIIKQACYSLSEKEEFNLTELILSIKSPVDEKPDIPFPQADDLDKVIDTLSLVSQGYKTKQEISEVLEFDERQGDYYANAARYLELLDRKDNDFIITKLGEEFIKIKTRSKRGFFIARQLILKPVFNILFHNLVKANYDINLLSQENIVATIASQKDLSDSTLRRRASTVKKWIEWVLSHAE